MQQRTIKRAVLYIPQSREQLLMLLIFRAIVHELCVWPEAIEVFSALLLDSSASESSSSDLMILDEFNTETEQTAERGVDLAARSVSDELHLQNAHVLFPQVQSWSAVIKDHRTEDALLPQSFSSWPPGELTRYVTRTWIPVTLRTQSTPWNESSKFLVILNAMWVQSHNVWDSRYLWTVKVSITRIITPDTYSLWIHKPL